MEILIMVDFKCLLSVLSEKVNLNEVSISRPKRLFLSKYLKSSLSRGLECTSGQKVNLNEVWGTDPKKISSPSPWAIRRRFLGVVRHVSV